MYSLLKLKIRSFLTKNNGYDRNHGPIPHIKAEHHIVNVDGNVRKPLELTIDQLKSRYFQHEIVSALQCAGNRRHTMRSFLKEVNGIDWGDAAVMNCKWKGPRLHEILIDVGVTVKTGHVAFSCHKTRVQDSAWYESSIELERAMKAGADVLLALEVPASFTHDIGHSMADYIKMNGEPLPMKHGYPVRIIVPGVSGCRSVKWLDRITVQSEESTNIYQRYDYKRLPPEATDPEAAKKYWDITPALQDMPINSVIAVPETGGKVRLSSNGSIVIKGYALPQADQGPVTKVEVSTDGGSTWQDANITAGGEQDSKWAWSLWEATAHMEKGRCRRLLSRATDMGGNVQKACPEWNLRGVGYDGYGEARDLTVS